MQKYRSAAIHETELRNPDEFHKTAAHFYCSFTDLSSQEPINLFGSLLVQLCNSKPSVWTKIDTRYRDEESKAPSNPARLGLADVETMLDGVCKGLPAILLFVDAVNESKQSSLILSTLWSLANGNANLQVIISSAEELIIPLTQTKLPSMRTVFLTPENVSDDIREYIEYWLDQNERLCKLPSRLKDDIRSKLLSRSDGV